MAMYVAPCKNAMPLMLVLNVESMMLPAANQPDCFLMWLVSGEPMLPAVSVYQHATWVLDRAYAREAGPARRVEMLMSR